MAVAGARAALAMLFFWLPSGMAASPSAEEVWHSKVVPILDRYCTKCHAGVQQKSGLDVRSLDTILRGGEAGPAIIPGKPEDSRLIQYVQTGADPHMPPEGKKQLTKEEIETLRMWVGKLPRPRSPLATQASTNTTWVPEYLADLRRLERPRFTPPPTATPSQSIDAILAADWREQKVKPAKLADDRTFVRRLYLDLAGRIPAPDELEAFLQDRNSNRRERLVDRLLASEEYPRHMREVFDVILMGRPRRGSDSARRDNGWFDFLEYSFRANRPWNEVVKDMILARGTEPPLRGANWFLYERRNNHQAMAEAIAPVAFGVQIGCAQCHNHPLSWEIEQRHYWGLVAAFNRSKNVTDSAGAGVAESAVGGFVQFANLKKESQPAVLAFLNGKTVPENRPKENEKEKDDPDLYVSAPTKEGQKKFGPPIPKFSRREALADSVTQDNPALSRAFVNRAWEIFLGRGIVHPADQIDSRHRPSHPNLLNWLAADFEQHGYDVKRLIRAIVLARAYQLDAKTPGRTPPPVTTFARAVDKPLSAEQLADSFLVAMGEYPVPPGEAGQKARELREAFVKRFPDIMPAVYNPSMEQALFWSNSPLLDGMLQPRSSKTSARLLALGSADARIEQAFLAVLGRSPDREERENLKALLGSESAEKGIKNLLWTLVASAEFQLNH